ncbi:hypothetical protein [Candidatus Laterigemmans baculatus]|uniref:hypothetical protein n=1 Tax=Candidatus Laterigemmans baculatus TaxID=2770505 RepID=UPI0013DBC89A|nr:hypothetical protein [Candidatus Laterigemmans baculatus]
MIAPMQLFAARIALLAYLVGGLAIPAAHQYGWVHAAAGVPHQGHAHGSHFHAGHSHAGHSHEAPCHDQASATASDGAASDGAAESSATRDCCPTASDRDHCSAIAATVPQDAACGDDCAVCGFTGSAQTPLAEPLPMLPPVPQLQAALAASGPGFSAADLRGDRLRGPPGDVILV